MLHFSYNCALLNEFDLQTYRIVKRSLGIRLMDIATENFFVSMRSCITNIKMRLELAIQSIGTKRSLLNANKVVKIISSN